MLVRIFSKQRDVKMNVTSLPERISTAFQHTCGDKLHPSGSGFEKGEQRPE